MPHRARQAVLAIMVFVVVCAPARALAWHNGVGRGDGFGTHDWVLFEADRLARTQGYRWLDVSVAQRACDDPDTVLGDFEHHVYDVWGTAQGDAPEYVAYLYGRAVSERASGDFEAASETLGLIAHYASDACDPLHTDDSTAEAGFRAAYEASVNSYTDVAGENRWWLDRVRVNYVYDVEARVIEAATASHADYETLVSRYPTTKMDSTALLIARRSVVRATDLLADIIASIDADGWQRTFGVARVSGVDRWATAAAISQAFTSTDATTVVVASGASFPDALSGAPLAAALNAPLLLVAPDRLPDATVAEIERIGPEHIVILGGEGAVGLEVEGLLRAMAGVTQVTRVAGDTRYGTSAEVCAELVRASGLPSAVFIATGRNFPDALSAAPVAAYMGYPVLLTQPDGLPGETASALEGLQPDVAYVLGGTAAVSAEVEQALVAMGIETRRVAGPGRYDTSAAVNGLAEDLGMSFDSPGVASGASFPDALAGGSALGAEGRVLLLTTPVRLPAATRDLVVAHASEITTLTLLGGEYAVSELAVFDAQSAVDPSPLPEIEQPEWQPCAFSDSNAYSYAAAIASFGPRATGTSSEHAAFDFIAAQLRSIGYDVKVQTFLLPNGRTTHNVYADKIGSDPRFIVLGAHVDTKYPSPGANDNGSGVGTVLELARAFSQTDTIPSLRFIFFGAEEMLDSTPSHHHYGSGYYVASLTDAQRSAISGMVSVDMVGYGTDYHARTMLVGPQSMSNLALAVGAREGISITFLKDYGTYGWSDHEPFERDGIPAVWLEWRDDPVYHTSADVASHLDRRCLKTAGDHLAGLVLGLRSAEMP